jgi:hypothetical protein
VAQSSSQKSRSAKQSLQEVFSKLKDEEVVLGITGRGDTEKTVLVPRRPGYIFVRIPKKVVTGTLEEHDEALAFSTTEHRHGMPVVLTRARDNPSRYVVEEVWPIGLGEAVMQSALSDVMPHRTSHELYSTAGGHDPVMLDSIQVRNLQVTPLSPASSGVRVNSGWYIWKDRAVHFFDGVDVDLSAEVPSGTLTSNYVSLWLDPTTDDILKTIVPAINTPNFLSDLEDLLVWPDENYVPLAGVRLLPSVYQIDWSTNKNANIIDMRPHQSLMPGDALPGGHPLDPGGGYHSGTLEAVHVELNDPSGTYDSVNVQDALENELGPERARVSVSSDDTTPGFLEEKIAAGTGVSLSTLNPAGDEELEISTTGAGDRAYAFFVGS